MSRHLNLLSTFVRRTLLVLLALVLLAAPGIAFAQTNLPPLVVPQLNWYTIYGGAQNDYARTTARDSSGNQYVASTTYEGWANTGMEPLRPFLKAKNPLGETVSNIVVAKYNSTGKLIWYTYYGGSQTSTSASKVLIDASGNLTIIGISNGNWDGLTPRRAFHGISWNNRKYANYDIFILKLNNAGAYQWHTYYGSDMGEWGVNAVRESNGNILIAGETEGPWAGLTPKRPFSLALDFFALSVDPEGTYRWHTFYGLQPVSGSVGNININEMQIDPAGDIYFAGVLSFTFADIHPLHPKVSSGNDILVMKMSKEGVLQWYTFYGGIASDSTGGMVLNGGNIYVTGSSYDDWPGLNPLAPFKVSPSQYRENLFVLKLNSSGAYQWHTFYGRAAGTDLVMDSRGMLYVSGYAGNISLNPITPFWGGTDILLMILNEQGTYISHAYYGSIAEWERAEEITLAGNKLYMIGRTEGAWNSYAPLHGPYDAIDTFLAEISIIDKPNAATTTTVTLLPNPVELGNHVILTANIASAGGQVRSGTVTFKDGAAVLGTVNVANGQAKLDYAPTVAGSHAIAAQFSGTVGFLTSQTSQAAVLQVVKVATTLHMEPYRDFSTDYPGGMAFHISLAPDSRNGIVPSGTIVLKAGPFEMGRTSVRGSTSSIGVPVWPAGQWTVSATYLGDSLYAESTSNQVVWTINKCITDVSLGLSQSEGITYGSNLTFEPVFSPLGIKPDGVVIFKDGDQSLANRTLVNGTTQYTSHTLLPGIHTFQVVYLGNTNYTTSSSAPRTIEILKGIPQILLSAEGGNPAAGGEERRINISVTGSYPDMIQPTGTVTLYEGETEIATLTLVNGVAVSEPITLSEGVHTFTAKYNGDALYLSETSLPSPVIVAGTPIYLPVMVR